MTPAASMAGSTSSAWVTITEVVFLGVLASGRRAGVRGPSLLLQGRRLCRESWQSSSVHSVDQVGEPAGCLLLGPSVEGGLLGEGDHCFLLGA